MARSPVDDAADELYGLPPGDFVAARNELVKRLKKEGDKEAAATVAALRRPNAAAWAVNQLVRGRRAEVEQLIGLGAALREAQAEAIAGADADELRTAARVRREAVAAMAGLAAAILAEEGSSPAAHANAINATLEAATLDAEAGEAVLQGRLTSELEPPSGFGEGPEVEVRPRPGGPAPKKKAAAAIRSDRRKAAQDAVDEARRNHDELNEEAVATAGRAESARRAAEQAKAEVVDLQRQLDEAERRARELAREADAAKRAATRAEAALTDAAKQLARAEDRLSELPTNDD